jgi:hypothetical protein
MGKMENLYDAGPTFAKEYAAASGWLAAVHLKPGWYVARTSVACVVVTGKSDVATARGPALRAATAGADFVIPTLLAFGDGGEKWFEVTEEDEAYFTAYAIAGGAFRIMIEGMNKGCGEAA